MNYEAFKSCFHEALKTSGLPMLGLDGRERLDPETMDRQYTVSLEPLDRAIGTPFHVRASITFTWDALLTARMQTIEEDVLAELLGSEESERVATVQPWVRIDIGFHADLGWGKSLPLPNRRAWANWVRETRGRLENVERIVTDDVVRSTAVGSHSVLA